MSGPGSRYSVGGRTLHAVVSGHGQVTVLLEAGGFAWSTDWESVVAALGPCVRTLAYDRAGLGWSDPGPPPRDLDHHLADLRALVDAAALPPPYILVGASYGGHIARAFAARWPDQVQGLVLVDARHPATSVRLPPAWRVLERNAVAATKIMGWLARVRLLSLVGRLLGDRALPRGAASLSPERRAAYLADCFGPAAWRTSVDEALAISASDAQAARIGAHPDLRLVVLRHATPDIFAPLGAAAVEAERAWVSMQEELAALSSRSELRVVEGAGHAIPHDRPDAVAAAIRSVLGSDTVGV